VNRKQIEICVAMRTHEFLCQMDSEVLDFIAILVKWKRALFIVRSIVQVVFFIEDELIFTVFKQYSVLLIRRFPL
jgi:hypothetical protein